MKPKNLRATDADRTDACALLDAALADGQLTAAEHDTRTAAALRAETFGALDRLVDDLQTPADLAATPLARGIPRAPRRWWLPVGAVLLAGLTGALAGLLGRTVGDTVAADPLPDFTTGPGFAHFLADYRAEFDSTLVDEVTVFPDRVTVRRAAGPGKQVHITYRGDFDTAGSPTSRQPKTPTLDLAEIDVAKLSGYLAGAPETAKVPGGAVWMFDIEVDDPTEKPQRVEVSIHVKNAHEESGHFIVSAAGEPVAVHPFKP
ncbi:DUF1707 SHOCT-like domain-containing protein [Nocardia sp. SSK8]|uniref:DUF1707 SHOCT-like domain-containing protein n=1 Tax=Nocardia sp. SSK8 TaxID=3120154 RepID=UPI003008B646